MFARKTVLHPVTGRTDRQTDRQTDRVRRNMRPLPREEGRIITTSDIKKNIYFRYQKVLFRISEIVLFDIRNSFIDIRNSCVIIVVWISKIRDVVLEASASARPLEAASRQFLAGSASPRPHTVLPRSRPYRLRLGSAS